MKLGISTILLLSILVISACSKNEDNKGGGNGQPIQNIPPQPGVPPGSLSNVLPFDNGQPAPMVTGRYGVIQNRKFMIYNTDGLLVNNCDPDPTLVCVRGADGKPTKQPLKYYTVVSNPVTYLQCINGGQNIRNVRTFDFRYACQMDNRRAYSKADRKHYCVQQTWAADPNFNYSVETQFYFDQIGVLNFRAIINNYEYKATRIGYKFNVITGALSIGRFIASGNNPNQKYLTVTNISNIKTRGVASSSMLLRRSDVLGLSDYDIDPGTAGFRFEEAIMMRLSNFNDFSFSYNQIMSSGMPNMPGQFGQGQFGGQVGGQFGPWGGQVGIHGQWGNQIPDPRFDNRNHLPNQRIQQNWGQPVFMVVGGNALLLDINFLSVIDSAQRANGAVPNYVPYDDPRI